MKYLDHFQDKVRKYQLLTTDLSTFGLLDKLKIFGSIFVPL